MPVCYIIGIMHGDPLKTYLIEQLNTAKKQVRSIATDADPEYLHRFRVALRRFRSVLDTYTDNIYAPDAIAKSLVKVTNPLRETDVFLASLHRETYPRLYKAVSKYRLKQYKRIWNAEVVERIDAALDALIQDVSALKLPASRKRLIKKGEALYEAARSAHRKLTPHSNEHLIHETRLRYKQARYVLEFLHGSNMIDAQKRIKKVKKTLEHFGAIQDAANQLEWLHHFCAKHPSKECGILYEKRKKELKTLKKHF